MPPKDPTADTAAPAELPLNDKPLVAAVVARGTVVHGDGLEAKVGDTVHLPEGDVIALRARGVLVDPSKAAIPVGPGPTFGSDEGPKITEET